ncbi:MAG: AmmeMemoRadiSam system protein A, partial [Lentisphaeria bacterium]|nr:AmmeMemoRadiSam system protein A [Lentisphaeria bacterium]
RDHTVEVHLPFLQVMGSRAKILPVLFGDPSVENCRRFVGALRRCASRRRIFLLASTDLAHYPTQADAVRLDALTMRRVTELDVKALFAHLRAATGADAAPNVKTALCASGGVGCAMVWTGARAGSSVQMLATSTSGDVPGGDASRVVGYAAALFVQNKEDKAMEDVPKQGFTVPADVQMELLALARRRIETAAKGEDFDYAPPAALKDVLSEPAAVFVTLHKDKRLRGCIGTTAAHDPLWQAVYRLAYSAAFEDHRFDRVTLAEAPQLHIEISVLSPVRRVASADEIVPGKHGVIVGSGYRRGLFLPQVWDQLPKKDEFMSILCTQKAHLSADAWKQADTELSIFTVFAFEEK